DENVLSQKLPMSLIHEGVGEVVFDSKGVFNKGTKVVMVPNTPTEKDDVIAENYLKSSYFRSSGHDGFMQDFVLLNHDRAVPLPDDIDLSIISYTELVTVSLHAIRRFEKKSISNKNTFGIWGDGNLGYITAILLRKLYPEAKTYVFGKTDYKLSHFSFVDDIFTVNQIPDDLKIAHAFECVGGKGSQVALQQIVEHISPEGSIALLGVSELPVEVNTRLVLEKGLTLIGSSRSGSKDFEQVVDLYRKYPDIVEKLALLKGHEINVCTMQDIVQAFEMDLSTSWGKTVLKWTI
ncbi:ribitol-5-phosphate dehydrogenase, partial [Staphylococcus aureus]|nr:ribitol-5-phosphate dehydrogenase [Staphylococcus aureus]